MKTTTIITAIIAIILAVIAPIAYLRSNENANATLDETVTNAGGEVTGKDETLLPSDDDADSADNADNFGGEQDADAGNNGNAETAVGSDLPANADDDKDVLVLSLIDGLNVRSGRGTSYASLGTLDKGDMVAYVSYADGWYETVYKERTAYISANENYTSLYYMDKGSERAESVIGVGKTLLGYPYVWGSQRYHWGNGVLNTNFVAGEFDCSALTQYAYYKGAGVLLDVTTRTQVKQGTPVGFDDLERGDLMFFTNSSRYNLTGTERVGHVAIYLGDNYILHTASDHAVIEPISPARRAYFIERRRVL